MKPRRVERETVELKRRVEEHTTVARGGCRLEAHVIDALVVGYVGARAKEKEAREIAHVSALDLLDRLALAERLIAETVVHASAGRACH